MSSAMSIVNGFLQGVSRMVSSLPRPSSLTCVSSYSLVQPRSIEDLQMWLQQDSLASPSPLPEEAKEKVTTETSGPKPSKSFARYDHDSASWKMSEDFSRRATSKKSSKTWIKAGIMLDGVCYRQPNWERRISEIGSGLWPSPKSSPRGDCPSERERRSPSLEAAVNMWPTPTVSGNHNRKGASKNSGDGLATAANFATPQARDYRAGETGRWKDSKKGYRSRNLNDQLGGKLNPAFVEWLMGWPLQWTSLEPLAIERFNEWFGNAIWWHAEFEDVPRLTQSHPGRVSRLKALGNGQVPFCMATAFRLLAEGMNI